MQRTEEEKVLFNSLYGDCKINWASETPPSALLHAKLDGNVLSAANRNAPNF